MSGSAGTGKTIVALHRAVYLARAHPESRVLLATFSDALATALRTRLRRLIGNEPKIAERLEVHSMSSIGRRLYAASVGPLSHARDEDVRELLRDAATGVEGHRFSAHFVWSEWSTVVDAWQLASWEDYRDVQRLGRKTRLAEQQRALLWSIFARVRSALAEQERLTEPAMFTRLAAQMAETAHPPFDFCVIDEAQDVGVAELRFLAALGGGRPDSLFFAGDLGQRIFQTPFSWRSLGVDVRGRSHTLRINYRTSHQIRRPSRSAPAPRARRRRRQRPSAGRDRLGVQRTGAGGQDRSSRRRTKRRSSRTGCGRAGLRVTRRRPSASSSGRRSRSRGHCRRFGTPD